MNKLIIEQNLSIRLLAKQFALRIKESGARRILVTSVDKGAGKTAFVDLISREGALLRGEKCIPLVTEDLYTTEPDFLREETIIVDGPSFMDEHGLHVLPEQWLMGFDAAVVIVSIRETKTARLKRAVEWLADYGIEHIWLVGNMRATAPLGSKWAQKTYSPAADTIEVKKAEAKND